MAAPAPAPAAPKRLWTTLDLLRWTKEYFERKEVDSPRLTAELLLAGALECDRVRLYVNFEKAVPEEALARFRDFVKRRGEAREPLQYILGTTEFLDLKLKVTPAVLIPRPETEELALWALEVLRGQAGERVRALDLGAGSGCLALALAAKEPRVHVTAVESSAQALAVARENAAALKLEERIDFREGDLFAPLRADEKGTFDLLVSNPPYIDPAQRDTLAPEVRDHEPAAALFAEEQGRAVLRRIIAGAGEWLRPGGRLGLEISPPLAAPVREMLSAAGCFAEVEVRRDDQKNERFAVAVRSAGP